MSATTDKRKTEWDRPAHFCAATDCRFGKATLVGKFIVSSVGEYLPASCDSLEGQWHPSGHERTYETMVFEWSGEVCDDPECHCGGIPKMANGAELDFAPANTREECLANHERIVSELRKKERA